MQQSTIGVYEYITQILLETRNYTWLHSWSSSSGFVSWLSFPQLFLGVNTLVEQGREKVWLLGSADVRERETPVFKLQIRNRMERMLT